MADFTWTHAITYTSGASPALQTAPSPELITDGDADMTFEAGDSITSFGSVYNYAGTAVVDGITWPVFDFVGPPFGFSTIFMTQAPVSMPATLSVTAEPIMVCFTAGTMIQTAKGETAVEALNCGDLVLTSQGQPTPIKWIGRQTVSTRFGPADRLRPVRFAAGSLGNGLPHSDLTVTADHAMLVDGVLCNASALVNGTNITRVPLDEMGDNYTVYHIETEAHEIILANGAATETYIDHTSRKVFDNYAEYEALYGAEPEMVELPLPRATTTRQLPSHVLHLLKTQQAA